MTGKQKRKVNIANRPVIVLFLFSSWSSHMKTLAQRLWLMPNNNNKEKKSVPEKKNRFQLGGVGGEW